MSKAAVVLVLLVALLGVGAASANSGFTVEGIDVSPKKVHFGTVTMGTCSDPDFAGCTVATITVTNTSSTQLLFQGAALIIFEGVNGISLGSGVFGNDGTCFDLPGFLEPGDSCTVLVSTGYSGLPGRTYAEVWLYGQFGTDCCQVIAKVPITVKLVS